MPYIVTTYTGPLLDPAGSGQEPDARRAVATLDEARTEVYHAAATALGDDMQRRLRVTLPTAEGGVISLPDGTVIEVEQIHTYNWFVGVLEDMGRGEELEEDATCAEIIDAYNAAQ